MAEGRAGEALAVKARILPIDPGSYQNHALHRGERATDLVGAQLLARWVCPLQSLLTQNRVQFLIEPEDFNALIDQTANHLRDCFIMPLSRRD